MRREPALWFRAGPRALARIRREGFRPADIRVFVGASGGAKWLALSRLDCAIVESGVLGGVDPVFLLGSSIGAWRMVCHAAADPGAAIQRFETAYIHQTYSDRPDTAEITATSREILNHVLGDSGVDEVLGHPRFHLSVMTVRARGAAASASRLALGASLGAAALANAMSRRTLGWFFERALFYDARRPPPFLRYDAGRMQRVPLAAANLAQAVLASGSIPMVLDGVRDIPGASPGVYRDGGITDYHFDMPFLDPARPDDGLVFYPHFYPYLIPGWFDKKLGRRARSECTDNLLLLCPSPGFVAGLPGGKIPDRHDFVTMDERRRIDTWTRVTAECERLADEFREAVDRGLIGDRVRPLAG